jgi:general secretion pathway protein M
MNLLRSRAQVAVALTFGALLLAVLLVGQYAVRKHLWAADRLAEIEPRHARLLGLRDAGSQLEQSLKEARAAVSRLGYPAARDAAQVGNDLQQLARRALQTAGMTIASSQVLAPRSDAGVDRVSVSVQAEGALSGLQVALAALQAETPAVLVDGLILQPTGRSAEDGTPIVSCRVTVTVLRLPI